MKRGVAALLGIAGIVTAVLAVQHIRRDLEYRRLLEAGDQAVRSGDAFAAIESLSGAITLRPDSMAAYFRRAQAYRAQRRQDEAIRDLRTASRLAPDATEPLVALGALADEHGDYASAAEWYGRAEERLQDEDPALLYSLALARYRAGNPDGAVAPLGRVIARRDPNGEAHYLLGLVYRDTNRTEEAIAILEEAVRIAPSLLPAREELADLGRVTGRTALELTQLEALTALDPRPDRRIALALSQARAEHFDEALATLGATTLQGGDDAPLLLARTRVYLARAERTGDRTSAQMAIATLQKTVRASPGSESLALYGRALYKSGNADTAERILKEAIRTLPVDVEAYAYLADAAEHLTHSLEALDALATLDALEGETASQSVRSMRARRLGALSLQCGDAPRAIRYLARAVSGGDTGPGTLGLLAEAHLRNGDPTSARDALGRALAQAPSDPTLLRLARSINR